MFFFTYFGHGCFFVCFFFPILTSICLWIYPPKLPPQKAQHQPTQHCVSIRAPNSSSAPLLVTISLPVFLAFHGDSDTIRVSGELSGRWILAPNTCQALPRMLAAPVTTARGFLENAKRWYFYRTMKTGAVAICIEDVIWSCRQRFKVNLVNCPFSLGQNTSPSCRF